MKRRTAVKSIAAAAVGTVFLTGCAEKNVVELIVDGRLQLDDKHAEYLSTISQAFLPIADLTPKPERPAEFILTMVNDNRPIEEITRFAEGFEQYKLLMREVGNKILDSGEDEVIPVVEQTLTEDPPNEVLTGFINDVRELSIYHFTTSEYFLVNHRDYQMIPPPYEGCINV